MEDTDGSLLVGTEGRGAYRLNRNNGSVVKLDLGRALIPL
jgi:hypothetical protein